MIIHLYSGKSLQRVSLLPRKDLFGVIHLYSQFMNLKALALLFMLQVGRQTSPSLD